MTTPTTPDAAERERFEAWRKATGKFAVQWDGDTPSDSMSRRDWESFKAGAALAGSAPPAPEVMDMALCDSTSVVLREGQLYTFRAVVDCKRCAALSAASLEAYGPAPSIPQAAPPAPVAPTDARWYCLSREGIATLCTCEEDAKFEAANAQQSYPRNAPYRAAQLVEAAPVAEGVSADAMDAARYRWLAPRLYGADFTYGEPPECVVLFKWPKTASIGADVRRSIDAAMSAASTGAAVKGDKP